MWLKTDLYFATIISPSPSGVEEADQYTWFTMDFFQSNASSQSFCLDRTFIFFWIPEKKLMSGIIGTYSKTYWIAISYISTINQGQWSTNCYLLLCHTTEDCSRSSIWYKFPKRLSKVKLSDLKISVIQQSFFFFCGGGRGGHTRRIITWSNKKKKKILCDTDQQTVVLMKYMKGGKNISDP